MQQSHVDDPPMSRLFVVCGKAVESDTLLAAFRPFGSVQNVKVIREKGVAYIKYDRASCAALAIENLNGAVLNNGRGPKLKVLLAEAPTARGVTMSQPKLMHEPELSSDPDNIPARSRLFIVAPKQADPQQIQEDISKFEDLEYCKTDLISTKGVVFCKFHRSSSALRALEDISTRGMVAGYKVKCMLAEPKTKRGRSDGSPQDMFSPMPQAAKLEYGFNMQGLNHSGMGVPDYAASIGLGSLAGSLAGFNPITGVSNMNQLSMDGLGGQVGLGLVGGLGNMHSSSSPVSPSGSAGLSRQRLFVVVHKGVGEDMVARLFRRFPGMEYCDLKKDRATGKSKGYAYVNYSTMDAACAAVDQLNGVEFPPHSGHRIKVMYAEPLGVRSTSGTHSPSPISIQASGTHSPSIPTPMGRNLAPDVSSVQDTLAGMTIQRVPSQSALEVMEDARMLPSPVNPTVARELMFSVG